MGTQPVPGEVNNYILWAMAHPHRMHHAFIKCRNLRACRGKMKYNTNQFLSAYNNETVTFSLSLPFSHFTGGEMEV